ncbi:MAG TPA: radical SAM protein [Candidatus Acidoferrales bacterium]
MTSAQNHKPRLVFWELTTGCNLRCIHCRATAQELSSPDDLPTPNVLDLIQQICRYSHPILILSGGEPLFRKDIFEIARYGTECGLRVALATNGTLVTPEVARKIAWAGVRRVSISLDGADAATHDSFRGIPGAFAAALRGIEHLQSAGVPVQINTTIARHNAHQLPAILDLALALGCAALHTFLLVPVGCGVNIAESQMVPPEEYEKILHWFYDRQREGRIEMKATCSPHYFRVFRQRQAAEGKSLVPEGTGRSSTLPRLRENWGSRPAPSGTPEAEPAGAPRETLVAHPGKIGVNLNTGAAIPPSSTPGEPLSFSPGHAHGHPGSPSWQGGEMSAMTKGCLAGSGVCFISHKGEVFPCGYLPVKAGDLRTQSFVEVWEGSEVFAALRDTANLTGKCGRCEFRNICLGCRARAYAATGDYLAEEPFCIYQPQHPITNPKNHPRTSLPCSLPGC